MQRNLVWCAVWFQVTLGAGEAERVREVLVKVCAWVVEGVTLWLARYAVFAYDDGRGCRQFTGVEDRDVAALR